ncbi:MAG: 50S ribosomal protein L21 [Limnothrix sp.]
MSYAIIETGGKQIRVEPGRHYEIERIDVDIDDTYTIDKVLLISDGDEITVGQPFIDGATVEGTVVDQRRAKKVLVYKMLPKKKTRKKRGHRQYFTRFMIDSISVGDKTLKAEETAETAEA